MEEIQALLENHLETRWDTLRHPEWHQIPLYKQLNSTRPPPLQPSAGASLSSPLGLSTGGHFQPFRFGRGAQLPRGDLTSFLTPEQLRDSYRKVACKQSACVLFCLVR